MPNSELTVLAFHIAGFSPRTDQEAAHPTLCLAHLDAEGVAKTAYPAFRRCVKYMAFWRKFLALYGAATGLVPADQTPQRWAKSVITATLYGGNLLLHDVPHIRALQRDVGDAMTQLTTLPRWFSFTQLYAQRKNPKFAAAAAILASLERDALDALKATVADTEGISIGHLMFDGASIRGPRRKIAEAVAQFNADDNAVKVAFKAWQPHPAVAAATLDLNAKLGFLNSWEQGDALPKHSGNSVCLWNALLALHPTSPFAQLPQGETPVSAGAFNDWARSVSQKPGYVNQPKIYLRHKSTYLEHVQDLFDDRDYLGYIEHPFHTWPGHWVAIRVTGEDVTVCDVATQAAARCSINVGTALEQLNDVLEHVFQLVDTPPEDDDAVYGVPGYVGDAAEAAAGEVREFTYHGDTCLDCGARLKCNVKTINCRVYNYYGHTEAKHMIKRCCKAQCQLYHAYNYTYSGGQKINSIANIEGAKVLFVNNKLAFETHYVKRTALMRYRAGLPFAAEIDVTNMIGDADYSHLAEALSDVVHLYYAVKYAGHLLTSTGDKFWTEIAVGDEISPELLAAFISDCHYNQFPPADRTSVDAIVTDGNKKLKCPCGKDPVPQRKSGRKRRDADGNEIRTAHGDGWQLFVGTHENRILWISENHEPECNAVVIDAMQELEVIYPELDTLIYDRACRFSDACRAKLKNVDYWIVDWMHAQGHVSSCACNPIFVEELQPHIAPHNSQAAEQTMSWLRKYARILNDARPARHRFCLYVYALLHNEAIAMGDTSHLPPPSKVWSQWRSANGNQSVCYPCTDERDAQ